MSTPAWREPVHPVMDEDTSVPQLGAAWRWLASREPATLDDPALIVLADVVAILTEHEEVNVYGYAARVVERIGLLYGVRREPERNAEVYEFPTPEGGAA